LDIFWFGATKKKKFIPRKKLGKKNLPSHQVRKKITSIGVQKKYIAS
jgi:hypothetical protein